MPAGLDRWGYGHEAPAAPTQLAALACGENASLACIESQADEDLPPVVPADVNVFVWLGEYQYPVEESIRLPIYAKQKVHEMGRTRRMRP